MLNKEVIRFSIQCVLDQEYISGLEFKGVKEYLKRKDIRIDWHDGYKDSVMIKQTKVKK